MIADQTAESVVERPQLRRHKAGERRARGRKSGSQHQGAEVQSCDRTRPKQADCPSTERHRYEPRADAEAGIEQMCGLAAKGAEKIFGDSRVLQEQVRVGRAETQQGKHKSAAERCCDEGQRVRPTRSRDPSCLGRSSKRFGNRAYRNCAHCLILPMSREGASVWWLCIRGARRPVPASCDFYRGSVLVMIEYSESWCEMLPGRLACYCCGIPLHGNRGGVAWVVPATCTKAAVAHPRQHLGVSLPRPPQGLGQPERPFAPCFAKDLDVDLSALARCIRGTMHRYPPLVIFIGGRCSLGLSIANRGAKCYSGGLLVIAAAVHYLINGVELLEWSLPLVPRRPWPAPANILAFPYRGRHRGKWKPEHP